MKPSQIAVTNNRSEIQALLIALFLCKWISSLYPESTFDIITDSMYTQKCLTIWIKTWLAKKSIQKNMDLLLPAYNIYLSLNNTNIIHVHSHISRKDSFKHPDFINPLYWEANHYADHFAKQGIDKKHIDEKFQHLFVDYL